MQIRGARRRRAVDRGFVLSDHADWDGLLATIKATGAEHIGVTHGYTNILVRYLTELGLDAFVMPTRFEGENAGDQSDNEEANADKELRRYLGSTIPATEVLLPRLPIRKMSHPILI